MSKFSLDLVHSLRWNFPDIAQVCNSFCFQILSNYYLMTLGPFYIIDKAQGWNCVILPVTPVIGSMPLAQSQYLENRFFTYFLIFLHNLVWTYSLSIGSPRFVPTSLPTQICVISFVFVCFTPVKSNQSWLCILGCVAFHGSMVIPPRTILLKETLLNGCNQCTTGKFKVIQLKITDICC